MPKNYQNKTIADPDIRDSGISERSDATPQGGSRKASAEELALALELSERRIAELEQEKLSKAGADPIERLAELLASSVKSNAVQAVPEADNLNRTTDFKNQRATIDGRGMLEAQQLLSQFRSERKKPISIPKAMANQVGSALAITINGVRVSIPCDGKTYYINETHWEHARERLAKLDILAANNEPQIVEIS